MLGCLKEMIIFGLGCLLLIELFSCDLDGRPRPTRQQLLLQQQQQDERDAQVWRNLSRDK